MNWRERYVGDELQIPNRVSVRWRRDNDVYTPDIYGTTSTTSSTTWRLR